MPCTEWSKLNHLQLGRYAEYYAKMEFASYGFEVYTSEVDDRGIDFICRKNGSLFEVQVKAVSGYNYTFMAKAHMIAESEDRLVCLLRFDDEKIPEVYLIPTRAWLTPSALLTSIDYEGKKSNPEWGINLSKKNVPLLQEFEISRTLEKLCQAKG